MYFAIINRISCVKTISKRLHQRSVLNILTSDSKHPFP